jgi:anti-sigma factor RsiW
MTCRHVEKMLPLYIEGDLKIRQARKVSEHLDSCCACRELADEYCASQAWFRSHIPPELDDNFFADLSASVKNAILQERKPPPWQPMALWAWNPIVTAALALLIIGCGIAFLVRFAGNQPVLVGGTNKRNTPVHVTSSTLMQLSRAKDVLTAQAHAELRSGERSHQSQASRSPVHENAAVIKLLEDQVVKAASPAPPVSTPAPTAGVDRRQVPLRIEIQTADPNIRIIWFATTT